MFYLFYMDKNPSQLGLEIGSVFRCKREAGQVRTRPALLDHDHEAFANQHETVIFRLDLATPIRLRVKRERGGVGR